MAWNCIGTAARRMAAYAGRRPRDVHATTGSGFIIGDDIIGCELRVEGTLAAKRQRGHRTSFNGARGTSDIEGEVTRVEASKPGGERVSIKKFIQWRVTRDR